MRVLQGQVKEKMFDASGNCYDKMFPLINETICKLGETGHVHDRMGVHSIENANNGKSITLHMYSPSYDECSFFCFEEKAKKTAKLVNYTENGKII